MATICLLKYVENFRLIVSYPIVTIHEDALNVPLMKLVPFEKLIISKRTNQSPQNYNYSSTSKIED